MLNQLRRWRAPLALNPAAAAAVALKLPPLPLLLPLTPAPVVGAAIVAVAVLHSLLELCRVPRFITLGPRPLR